MSIHGILGEITTYPKVYDPNILYAIPRALGRNEIIKNSPIAADSLAIGVDWWHAFEVAWLNKKNVSQVAIARINVPANTPNIVESKSLKLYLNSLNFTQFTNEAQVTQTIEKDVSTCVDAKVFVDVLPLDQMTANSGFLITQPTGTCIDDALANDKTSVPLTMHPDRRLLGKPTGVKNSEELTHYEFYSNLLRSNCPVTNQPDWGTLAVSMRTNKRVEYGDILGYVLSYRQHNGFHEQCVEQIFADLLTVFTPQNLMVRAWYTRRGGIDINPCRVSSLDLLPKPSRLIRQ